MTGLQGAAFSLLIRPSAAITRRQHRPQGVERQAKNRKDETGRWYGRLGTHANPGGIRHDFRGTHDRLQRRRDG